MRLTFLGTGAAGGVPLYGCPCAACNRARIDSTHVRRPCSALIETATTRILLDAGLPDLHERFEPGFLSAIVLTHFHPDHVQGLFHLRWGKSEPLAVYCPPDEEGCADLFRHSGFLRFTPVQKLEGFRIGDVTVTGLQLIHSKLTYGYCLQSDEGCGVAYLTDTVGLPDKTLDWLSGHTLDAICLDTSHPPAQTGQKLNHNDLTLSLEIVRQLKPRHAYLTHIGHEADCWLMRNEMDTHLSVSVARDGEIVEFRR